MPLKRCTKDGKSGWKYGDQGVCYVGPDAKEKAIRQAIAISKSIPDEGLVLEQDFEETYNDYPEAAKQNAAKALDWIQKYGRNIVTAGTRVGLARANQLAKGEGISRDTIARMAAFARHRKNAEIDPKYKGKPWLDKGYVAWLLWGGTEGVDWAIRKIEQIDKKD